MSTPTSAAPPSSPSVAGAGSGSTPCAAVTRPRANGSGERDDALDTELVEERERTADVDERVERAELVEVDVLGRNAVDAALDLGEARERLQRPCPHALGKVRRLDELADVAVGAMRVIVG